MKIQILVVDDDLIILKLLNFILSRDYELTIKDSGIEALNWLEEGNDPALIISDLEMPYLDGSSFIHNLKISGYYRDTPVIMLSGAFDLEERVAGMQYKVDGHLHKPFNPADLKKTISNLLNRNILNGTDQFKEA